MFIFCKNCFQPTVTESEPKHPELSLIGSALSGLYRWAKRSLLSHIHTYVYRRPSIFCDAILQLRRVEMAGISTLPAWIITRLQHYPSREERNISNRITLSKLEQGSPQDKNWVVMIFCYHFNYSFTSFFSISKATFALFSKNNDRFQKELRWPQ